MIEEIGRKNEELFHHSETLEARVAERTESLYIKTIELEASRQRVIEAERSALAGRIAGGVAHEINNPSGFIMSNLETLKGYIETLSQLRDQISTGREVSESDRSELDWVMEDAPALIEESLDGMHRIVKIARNLEISAYPDKGGYIDADVAYILGRAMDATCAAVQQDGRLIKKMETGLNLRCNPILCESALTNILQNALDHVGETGTIEVGAGKDAHNTIIRIANTGEGIAPEIMPYLFEPFFTTKAPGKGTGLGLTISKGIIEKAGGSIGVESENGRTVFTITLPFDPTS
jgi:signal transduction histidine kinase